MKKAPVPMEVSPQDQTSMTDQRMLDILQGTKSNLESQRHHIQHLQPKAEAWDVLCTVVGALAPRGQYGIAADHNLDDAIQTLKNRIEQADKPQ